MAAELENHNCILTGASQGLGAQIATTIWGRGANVLLVGRSAERLERRRQELESSARSFQQVHVCVADLGSPDSPGLIIDQARRHFQRLDSLVNNAAVQGPIGQIWTNNWREWVRTIEVDLVAPAALCQLAVPWMRDSGGGSIVSVSGGGATGPRPHFSAYATAKAALVRFTETLAAETADLGMRANCVAPGALNTQMLDIMLDAGVDKVGREEFERAVRRRQQGGDSVENAAELVAFLISPASAGITGRLISAVWDPWRELPEHADALRESDVYTLRRITPEDRGLGELAREPES